MYVCVYSSPRDRKKRMTKPSKIQAIHKHHFHTIKSLIRSNDLCWVVALEFYNSKPMEYVCLQQILLFRFQSEVLMCRGYATTDVFKVVGHLEGVINKKGKQKHNCCMSFETEAEGF